MDTQEFGGAASGEGVHLPKKSTRSRHIEEFKTETGWPASLLLTREAYPPALLRDDEPVSVKLVSNSFSVAPAHLDFLAICSGFRSEPPRTRTWNLEIKSLLLCQLS